MATAEHPDKWRRPYRAPPRRCSPSAPEQAVEEGPAAALRGGIAGIQDPRIQDPRMQDPPDAGPSDAGPGMQGPGCRVPDAGPNAAFARPGDAWRIVIERTRPGWSKAQPLSGPATPPAGDFHRNPSRTPRSVALAVSVRRSRCTRHRSPCPTRRERAVASRLSRRLQGLPSCAIGPRTGRRQPRGRPGMPRHRSPARWHGGRCRAPLVRDGDQASTRLSSTGKALVVGRSASPAMTAPRRLRRAPRNCGTVAADRQRRRATSHGREDSRNRRRT